jgi:CubicO group peptidase (beta-lactamase class C family)
MSTVTRREFTSLIGAATVGIGTLGRTQSIGGRERGQAPLPRIQPPSHVALERLPLLMEVGGVPGVAAAVVQDGKTVWQHLAGMVEAGTDTAVVADTLLPAASLGKPVFAHAVLRLVEQGLLRLDVPLKKYVADHAPADARGDRVTVGHVLGHSTGFRNWRNNRDQPLVPDFEPGARFQYSGEGFYYLQRAVEAVMGMGFDQFMQEHCFGPLGTKSSTYAWRGDTDARLWVGHQRGNPVRPPSRDFANRLFEYARGKGKSLAAFRHEDVVAAMEQLRPAPAPLPNFMIPNAAGSLLTTLGDYAIFLNRVLLAAGDEMDLQQDTRKRMFAPHTRINSVLSWGLGWGVEAYAGREYIWHWGDNGTYKNFVLAHLPTRSAVVVFTNGSNGMRIAEYLVEAATGLDHPAFDWL